MNPIYIIQYDNGQDYEDHSAWPVLASPTKERAEQIIGEVKKWANETVQRMPALYELPDVPEDEDYDKLDNSEKVRRAWLENIEIPYGIREFVTLVNEHDSFYRPNLYVVDIPFEGEKT